jgi:hypothetical protein
MKSGLVPLTPHVIKNLLSVLFNPLRHKIIRSVDDEVGMGHLWTLVLDSCPSEFLRSPNSYITIHIGQLWVIKMSSNLPASAVLTVLGGKRVVAHGNRIEWGGRTAANLALRSDRQEGRRSHFEIKHFPQKNKDNTVSSYRKRYPMIKDR